MKTPRPAPSTIVKTRRSTRTTKSPASRLVLGLTLAALTGLSLLPSMTQAEDEGAHGGDAGNTASEALAPGEAVKASRTTERYTEKGLTQNPIAIDFDPQGNLYIAEGWRAGISVIDNRNSGLRRSNGVINDLQKKSVEDRLAQIKMLEEGGFYPKGTFTKSADKVRFIQDTDGDGKADKSTIFADGFDDPLDGIASGVLFHDGKVYLTNIPHVWLLEDKDGDGDADETTEGERVSLSYGWGIRWAFYGHDMHGLIKGPDGRIYFSIGDRGYNVTTKEGKQLYGPDRGAVFRMWPDGSGLELYFEGLRNPQELAFDNYGNLFTGDNNSDSGDKARFHYLPEGGDAGWRQDVQSLRDRGPWNREHMWEPRDVQKYGLQQPAWIIPPLKNVGRGPSGLAHYPGTGDVFAPNGSFLMCDYPAGVRHVQVEPSGAGFTVTEDSKLPTDGNSITDVAWGYNGRLYLADWGGGWKPNPNGYIKTMKNEAAHAEQAKQIAQVKQLFAEGIRKFFTRDGVALDVMSMTGLLANQDQRVRLAAQYEIATHPTYLPAIWKLCFSDGTPELMRVHAIWTVAMCSRQHPEHKGLLADALNDSNTHVRAQAVAAIGDLRVEETAKCIKLLMDNSSVVQHHAAIALGKIGDKKAIAPLLDLLDRNDNKDVNIRHAASYGLSLIGDAEAIHKEATKRGVGARVGAVLALRRLDSPLLADYLSDEDELVAAEAVRAIYDKRVMDAMPALAKLIDTLPADRMSEPVMRRVIEANVRLADADSVGRLASLGANAKAPDKWRELALKELNEWSAERDREGVWGSWWPRGEQSMDPAVNALTKVLPTILKNSSERVQELARTPLLAREPVETLDKVSRDRSEPVGLRKVALKVLVDKDRAAGKEAVVGVIEAEAEPSPLKIAARLFLTSLDKPAAIKRYLEAAENAPLPEQQDAVRRLSELNAKEAYPLFDTLAKRLKSGDLPPGLKLDVYEAVSGNRRLPQAARVAVSDYKASEQVKDESPFIRDTVFEGGSIDRGRKLFYEHPAAECQRCHTIGGGANITGDLATIGPDLAGIGARHNVGYLYTSLVKPSADFAKGYEKQMSDMPAMTDKLSARELRDVLAYLVSLKTLPDKGKGAGATGPVIKNPMKDASHAVWLPIVLGGVTLGLVLLLFGTVLMARREPI